MPEITNAEIQEQLTLAVGLQRQGQFDRAIEIYQHLLPHAANQAPVLYLLGLANQESGRLNAAVNYIARAVYMTPEVAEYHLGLGILYALLETHTSAMEQFRAAIQLAPELADPYLHLGNSLLDVGDLPAASAAFRAVLARNPKCEHAHIDLGLCLKAFGQLDEALACFQAAQELVADNPVSQVNRAHTLLLREEYAAGWEAYAWRLQLSEAQLSLRWIAETIPLWQGDGAALAGKTLLVLSEQGIGDNIQFIRFLPRLQAVAGRVLLTVPQKLLPLVQGSGFAEVVVARNQLPTLEGQYDYYCPLLCLPRLFQCGAETIPAAIPYLQPDPARLEVWRERFMGDTFKVGLVWRGKPLHQRDPFRNRSMPLSALAPLGALSGVTFYSIQRLEEGEEHGRDPMPERLSFINLAPYLEDFAETAAAMAHLDLIITIDTAAAHLAGALGKPVWTLLPYAPDWRWQLTRTDSPWYPTMRLFRQEEPGNWTTPMAQVTAALAQRVAMIDKNF